MSHPKTKIALALLALFVSGALAGVAIGRRFPSPAEMRQLPPTERASLVLEQMAAELRLSSPQKEQLQPLVKSAVVKARTLAARQQQQRMALIASIDAEVVPVLSPEQRRVFEKLRAEHRGRMLPIRKSSDVQP